MLFFVANDGTIIKSGPSSVYQGSEDASCVSVVAPFATNAEVTAVFKLPNGELKSPLLLTNAGIVEGVINKASGKSYALWKRDLPEPITRYYGEATVQFFFYLPDRVITTSASSFMVGRGVGVVLPDTPSQSIYEDILSSIASLRSQLDNGAFTARSIYQWNVYYAGPGIPDEGYGITKTGQYCKFHRYYDGGDDTGTYTLEIIEKYAGANTDLYYIDENTDGESVGDFVYDISEEYFHAMATPVYGVNEIVFYPNIGEFGAFVKSIKENNSNNPPYIDGELNSEWWAEVVNFNTITEDYLTTLNEAIEKGIETISNLSNAATKRAEDAAALSKSYAQNAGESARTAQDAQTAAKDSAQSAASSSASSKLSADNAADSANKAQNAVDTAQGMLDDLDESLKEAAAKLIVETDEKLKQVIADTESSLSEIRAATEQAQQKAEDAQTAADESAQSAANSAQSAEETLASLADIEEKLTATKEVLDTALDYIHRLEEQIVAKIGTSVFKDGNALAQFNVSATPTADAGALYDDQGNLKSNSPAHNNDCVRVEDIASLLVGGGFNSPLTTESGDEIVTENGDVLQINLSLKGV